MFRGLLSALATRCVVAVAVVVVLLGGSATLLPTQVARAAGATTLRDGRVDVPYFNLLHPGSLGPVTLLNGALPRGLTVDPSGVLSGTPEQHGTFNFAVHDADRGSDEAFRIDILMGQPLIKVTSKPPSTATVGDSFQIQASSTAGLPVLYSIDSASTLGSCTVSTTGLVRFTGTGSCVVDLDSAGDAEHDAAPRVQSTTAVSKRTQAITFTSTAPSTGRLGSTYSPTATGGGSGNPVTFKIDAASDAGVCVIDSGGFVHFTGVGTCVVGADQAGDTTYSAAPHVTQTIAVAKRTQTIRVTSTPPTTPFVGDEYQITATGGGSLNPVTYSLDPASRPFACNVDDTGLVVFTGAGPCVIDLDQAGDARYLAAPQVSLSMTVGLHSQTIAFTSTPPAAPVVGDTYAVTATGGDSGHPVIFTIDPGSDPGVCSFDGSGLLHFFRAGKCVIGADQAGDDAYSAAPHVSQTVTVGKAPQILDITSTPPAHPVVGDTYQVTAAGGGSPLPLVVSIDPASDTDVCSVDVHGLVTFTSGGTCRIDVDQAGDRNYLPAAQVQQVVTVDRAAQAITVTSTAPPDPVVGGTYQVTATGGGSGQAVQVSIAPASDAGACTADASGLVTFTGAGTCVIDLFQPGDAAYQPAHLEVSLTVGALPTPTPQPTSSPGAPGAVQAEQSDGLPFTGTAAGPLLVVGSALCVAGLVLLLTGRRGRPRHRH